MNAERLLQLYDRVSEAPDAIPRLRGFILDLAVRGKLVEQNPDDEPASNLLKKIELERAEYLKRVNKGRTFRRLGVPLQAFPFDVPSSWEWSCLGNVLLKITDGTHHSPPNTQTGDFLYITAKNIKEDGVSLENVTYVAREVHDAIFSRCDPARGDVLYIKDGATTGVATVNNLDEPFSMLSSVALLKVPASLSNRLLVTFLRSPFFYEQMRGFMKGAAITRVTLKRMAPALLPIPPLPEQSRIVAKVDELMALCDSLEAERENREAARDRLTTASLSRLTAPDVNEKQFKAHADIAIRVLPELTTRPDQIKALRQTILDLAVRGKLVEQDPNDEPASELVAQLAVNKTQLVNDGEMKRDAPPMLLAKNECPFDLPDGWVWTRVGNLIKFVTSGSRDWAKYYSTEGAIFLRMGNLSRGHYLLRLDQVQRVMPPADGEGTRTRLEAGDILISITGDVGMLGLIPEGFGEAYINQHTAMVRPMPQLTSRYLPELFRSPLAQAQFNEPQRGIKNSFRLTDVTQLIVPLPPLGEQHRIVAKVDELMAYCDQLEQDLLSGRETRSRLLEELLVQALKGTSQQAA